MPTDWNATRSCQYDEGQVTWYVKVNCLYFDVCAKLILKSSFFLNSYLLVSGFNGNRFFNFGCCIHFLAKSKHLFCLLWNNVCSPHISLLVSTILILCWRVHIYLSFNCFPFSTKYLSPFSLGCIKTNYHCPPLHQHYPESLTVWGWWAFSFTLGNNYQLIQGESCDNFLHNKNVLQVTNCFLNICVRSPTLFFTPSKSELKWIDIANKAYS